MNIPENVRVALDRLSASGFDAYLVGGCVRDFVRGKTPSDFDITTPSTPEETKEVFSKFNTFLQGEKHGTVGVIINGEKLEITTHRHDGDYIDHRRPESVTFSREVADDLSRRDFTVNALAYSMKSGLVDLFGGIGDIENRVIRCVGDPDRRFDEDALRILRALRFSSTLGFKIEEKTKASIFKNAHLLNTVSAERIREELLKLVCGENAVSVIKEYREIIELVLGKIDTDTFCENAERLSDINRSALFFCTVNAECIKKLKFSNDASKFYNDVRKLYFSSAITSKHELKNAVFTYGENAVRCALKIKEQKNILAMLDEAVSNGECMHKKDLKINGRDLALLGYKTGKELGEVLDRIFDLVLRDELPNNRDELIEYAKKEMV